MITTTRCSLIPVARDRLGMDPIFRLHGEAAQRKAAGESILDCTMGSLMDEEGRLSVMPTVAERLRTVPLAEVSG